MNLQTNQVVQVYENLVKKYEKCKHKSDYIQLLNVICGGHLNQSAIRDSKGNIYPLDELKDITYQTLNLIFKKNVFEDQIVCNLLPLNIKLMMTQEKEMKKHQKK